MKFAQEMHKHLRHVGDVLGIPNLKMRIGLHLGHFVGGVLGTDKLRFDVFGVDVLTAMLMESEGVPNEINVSAAFKTFCEKHMQPANYNFKFNRQVQVRKRMVDSFLVSDLNSQSEGR